MQKIRGEITSINGFASDREIYLTIRLPDGHIVNVRYPFGSHAIARGVHSSLSTGDVVSCRIKENLDLTNNQSYSGYGAIKKHDPTDILDDVFEDFLGGASDRPFEKDDVTLISIFCSEAAEAVKREFHANSKQSEVIDAEFYELAAAAKTETKESWKKRFLAVIVNIGSAIAIDQVIGTSFVITLAAILKEVIRGITKKYLLDDQDSPNELR